MEKIGIMSWMVLALLGLSSCQSNPDSCPCAQRTMRLSCTTSVDNSGLLTAIIPPFEQRTGISVHVLAVGTGKALKLAENGDVDAVLVHDRLAEDAFMRAGHGIHHMPVMHNDFVIVGSAKDPAAVRGLQAVAALEAISRTGSTFVSRGDDSGTHKAELRLWAASKIVPAGKWYLEAGQGMRLTLQMASEKQAYCILDRATFLTAAKQVQLEILVEKDPILHNPYSIMAVNPARHPKARFVEAMAFAAWLTSVEGQRRIGAFRIDDQILFYPEVAAE